MHKAIELAELSRNNKKDHVSQMSMSERSAPAEHWPAVCVCKISGSYSMVCTFLQT